jgi:hypothetical protein
VLAEKEVVFTCSLNLFSVKVWDPATLDLLGMIDTKKEIDDANWFFPLQANKMKRQEDFATLKRVMREIQIDTRVALDPTVDFKIAKHKIKAAVEKIAEKVLEKVVQKPI